MGLFHLKMVCTDAIWQIFIEPKGARADSNSLIEHVACLRPKETRKIESNPGFRRMHEVIQHVGIVSRLDCWRLAVAKLDPGFESLEGFAKSKPTFEQLEEIAKQIVLEHIGDSSFSEHRRKQTDDCDKINENMVLLQQYFLLYKEITYALNQGDIGRSA
jgi:hypothetical protein